MEERILFFTSDTVPETPNERRFISESEPCLVIDKYEWANNEIDRAVSLKQNWDGQGGMPVFEDVGVISKKLITTLNFIDGIADISPNPHGTLTIEWVNIKKEKLSLEIGVNTY